jgi:glycosyltransferase involved in cell wall biosynthesis
LHKSLGLAGQESTFLVAEKETLDPSVTEFEPAFDIRTRVRRGISRRLLSRSRSSLDSRPAGASYFSDDRSQHGGDMLRQALPTDVINLHWVAGFIGYREFFRAIPSNLPMVWTLHDMNPFTGGCHHAGECRRFFEQCGMCPQLGSTDARDFSHQVWRRKHESFDRADRSRFCVVTPSRWMADEVKRSSLMGNFTVQVIPYSLDTDCFRPADRQTARRSLGIPPDAKVLLFVSHLLSNKYKGADLLVELAERLRTVSELFVLSVGQGTLPRESDVRGLSISTLQTEEQIAVAYNAADVFVLPTLQDNFPNTALEALACGVPVVAFNVGGVPEIVREGCTGMLAAKNDVEGLARAVTTLLNELQRREEMAVNCRRVAIAEYALDVQASRYVELYERLMKTGHDSPSGA